MANSQHEYLQTHPHLSFELNLTRANPRFWLLLGEISSKCAHVEATPITKQTLRQLNHLYLARGVNATTAIEGNTLEEEEVLKRISGDLKLPKSKDYLGREVDNIVRAYNEILRTVSTGTFVISVEQIKHWNKMILSDLEVEDHVEPGEVRSVNVHAGPYLAPPARDAEHLLHRLCDWLNSDDFESPDGSWATAHSFIKAVTAHVYIEWIHAFGDGNGRLGRLIEFACLANGGIPAVSSHVLQSHYNDTRTDYYRRLNESSQGQGDLTGFLTYAAQGFRDGLAEQLDRLNAEAELLMWRVLVDEALAGRSSDVAQRRRALALELGKHENGVPRDELITLTSQIAKSYMSKTTKTLSRDLGELDRLKLIEVQGGRVKPRLWRVRALRPWTMSDT